jgi:hypothetical protein
MVLKISLKLYLGILLISKIVCTGTAYMQEKETEGMDEI